MKRRRALRVVALALACALAPHAAAQAPAFRPLGAAPEGEPVLRVYVVRHAQAWKNVSRALRPPGITDAQLDSLTEKGLTRARAIGARLEGAGVTRVLSSPAQRTQQTAEAIASVLGTGPIEVRESFEPMRHGASKQAADYHWRIANWKSGRDPRPSGGESLEDAQARAVAALDAIAQEAPGTTVVVVTHGEITAALLSKAAGVSPLAGYDANFVGEGTISDVAIGADGWELLAKGRNP